jgi:hypothetical protein
VAVKGKRMARKRKWLMSKSGSASERGRGKES